MTAAQLIQLMQTPDMTRVMGILEKYHVLPNYALIHDEKQYQPHLHKVHDPIHRPNKYVKDEKGNITKMVPVNRLSLALQKKIVLFAQAFLGVPRIDSVPNGDVETNMQQVIEGICDANHLDYLFPELMRIVMSERHAAELWYPKDVDKAYDGNLPFDSKFELSVRILANSRGDRLYPVFDEYENLIAFGRLYFAREMNQNTGVVEEIEHFDIYSDATIWYSKKVNTLWNFSIDGGETWAPEATGFKNPWGKIPVIYYRQPNVEWSDVQPLIERLETKISNHSDTNDYFDSPVVVTTGSIEGFADKGSSGKVLEAEEGAKVEYLTWDSAPAAMKMEMDNLNYFIHSLTHTPDISFENVKGLGKLSGIALKLLFMDAHLKAGRKEPIFGIGIKQRLALLKTAVGIIDHKLKPAVNMKMTPKFTYFMPEDVNAIITSLNEATEGGILSTDSAIDQNPMVSDPESEKTKIAAEKAANQASQLALATAGAPKPVPVALPGKNPEPAAVGD